MISLYNNINIIRFLMTIILYWDAINEKIWYRNSCVADAYDN